MLAGANFADTVNGYVKYSKVNTFIDYFILNELSKNVDGYRLSTFLYKDKFSKGGKLGIGPPWDYDIAWLNADYCAGSAHTGWAYQFGNVCPGDGWQLPFWWNRLMQDARFRNDLKCRWLQLRGSVLATSTVHAYLDSMALYLAPAMGRNFTLWPILGVYVWPNPSPIPTTYQGEIDRLKQWIGNRMNWMDANMPGTCTTTGAEELLSEKEVLIAPNPSKGIVHVQWVTANGGTATAEVYTILGEKIGATLTISQEPFTVDLSARPDGIYFLKLFSGQDFTFHKIIKAN